MSIASNKLRLKARPWTLLVALGLALSAGAARAEEAAPDQSASASAQAERAATGDEEEGVTHGV